MTDSIESRLDVNACDWYGQGSRKHVWVECDGGGRRCIQCKREEPAAAAAVPAGADAVEPKAKHWKHALREWAEEDDGEMLNPDHFPGMIEQRARGLAAKEAE